MHRPESATQSPSICSRTVGSFTLMHCFKPKEHYPNPIDHHNHKDTKMIVFSCWRRSCFACCEDNYLGCPTAIKKAEDKRPGFVGCEDAMYKKQCPSTCGACRDLDPTLKCLPDPSSKSALDEIDVESMFKRIDEVYFSQPNRQLPLIMPAS